MFDRLCMYLPLFERWITVFPKADYTELSQCIENTCVEFVAFLVKAIIYLRKRNIGMLAIKSNGSGTH